MIVIATAKTACPMHRNETADLETTAGIDNTTGHTNISKERKNTKKVRDSASLIKVSKMERHRSPEKSHEKKRASEDFIRPKRVRHAMLPRLNRASIAKMTQFTRKYKEQAKAAKDEFLRTNFQSYIEKFLSTKRIEAMDGEERLNLIEKLIRMFLSQGIWKMQMRFINACNNVNLRNILGDSYHRVAATICQQRGWDIRMPSLLNVIAPRRGGKTTVAAAVFAAYLIAIPGLTALNTAGGRKMAGEFLHIVGQFLSRIPDVAARSSIHKEEVSVKGELDGSRVSRLKCLASQGPAALAVGLNTRTRE